MIKSLIILVLLVICLAGAALSCPSQDNFTAFYADKATADHPGMLGSVEKTAYSEYAKTYTYQSNILWATASKNGKVVFTGAFNHWFTRDDTAAKPDTSSLTSIFKK